MKKKILFAKIIKVLAGLILDVIKEFGFTQPVVVDKDNNVVAGHGRILGAKKAGLKEEDVFVSVDGTSVKGKSATEVANMLKSDSVKTSTIVVKRNDKELTFKVTKENITLFSVSSFTFKFSLNLLIRSIHAFGGNLSSETM